MAMYCNDSMNESCLPSNGKDILDYLIKFILEKSMKVVHTTVYFKNKTFIK